MRSGCLVGIYSVEKIKNRRLAQNLHYYSIKKKLCSWQCAEIPHRRNRIIYSNFSRRQKRRSSSKFSYRKRMKCKLIFSFIELLNVFMRTLVIQRKSYSTLYPKLWLKNLWKRKIRMFVPFYFRIIMCNDDLPGNV